MAPRRRRKWELAADPGEPLVHSDGEVYEPDTHPTQEQAKLPARPVLTPMEFKASTRRAITELPATLPTMNGLAVVLVYTLLGVSDREIAGALNVDPLDIEELKKLNAYTETFEHVLQELIGANSALLQGRIAAHTHVALDKVIHLATTSKKEDVALRASTDILDRAGARPQDNVMRRQAEANELRIVITSPDNARDVDISLNGKDV